MKLIIDTSKASLRVRIRNAWLMLLGRDVTMEGDYV